MAPDVNTKNVVGRENKNMYTDPGLVPLVIGIIVGAIVSIPAWLFIFKSKVKGWFDGIRKKNNKE